MVPPNNLGPDLSGKAVNETQYRGMIGSLMYLTTSILDIQFSTCLCARYQANPKESHLIAVKRIFRYLKGTPSLGLWYPKCLGFDLKGYSDSDYAGCNMDKKSTSAEAEYVAAAECCANILWIKSQLTDYDIIYEKVPIFCDNTSAIAISNNPVLHSRTKHIDIRYHFIGDHILKGYIELHFIPIQYQLDDIFTKPLDELTFKRLIVELEGHDEEGAHPQLSSGTNKEFRADDISKKIKLEDLSEFLKDTRSAFFTPDSPQDDPIIVTDESEEEEADKEDTHDTSHDKDELKQQKATTEAEIASLKAMPSYLDINQLITLSEIKELKQHVKDMEIELPGDLKEIPTKLETFTSTISSLTSQFKISSSFGFPSSYLTRLLNLDRFLPHMVENATDVNGTKDVLKQAKQMLNVTTEVILINTVTDNNAERKKSPYATNLLMNFDTKASTLKIYREDGSEEVISNLKVLRRLESIFTSVYAAVQKLKKDSWKELQFSLVDNSKPNVVYLLNRS
ncbi:hypothetical protein Tco_0409805 [Tanacetum coccineum]